jgi:acyl carrier protein
MTVMREDVEQRVRRVVSQVLNVKEDDIRMDASFREDLATTSLDYMTLFVALEDEFQRSIAPEQVTGLDTPNDVVEFICNELRQPLAT